MVRVVWMFVAVPSKMPSTSVRVRALSGTAASHRFDPIAERRASKIPHIAPGAGLSWYVAGLFVGLCRSVRLARRAEKIQSGPPRSQQAQRGPKQRFESCIGLSLPKLIHDSGSILPAKAELHER
jgi:hypothetical protein